MIIEPYSDQYEGDVHRLTQEFHKESLDEYGLKYNERALNELIQAIKYEAFLIIIDGKAQGMLAGKEVKAPGSPEKIWHEVVWFVSKPFRKYGMKLFNAGRKAIKERGFEAMVMVHMHNSKSDKLARLYQRLGFTPMETNYIGRL